MDITKRYLLALLSAKDIERTVGSNIDYTMRGILEYVGMNPSSSIYDCHKFLNNVGMQVSYENIDVQINNSIKLGLVQKDTNIDKKNKNAIEEDESVREKPKNSTIYYSISSAGIFYLFRTNPEAIDIELILSNKEDGLFINSLSLFGLGDT